MLVMIQFFNFEVEYNPKYGKIEKRKQCRASHKSVVRAGQLQYGRHTRKAQKKFESVK